MLGLSPAVAGIVVALAAVLAHLPSITQGGFVWDDDVLLLNNKLIHADNGLEKFWFSTEAPDYLPVTWTNLWLEYRLWGKDPTGYHAVNVLMHAGAAVLLLALLRRLGAPGAFWGALLFAVHPVTVASVAWISERKNTLSILFYLASLIWFVDHVRTGRWSRYAWSLAAFLLALLSKASVVTLPVVLWLILWWSGQMDLRRVWAYARSALARAPRPAVPRAELRWALRTLPFFALAAATGLETIWFQKYNVIVDAPMPVVSWAQRIAVAGQVVWFYLYKGLWPLRVTMVYEKWHIDARQWLSYVPTGAAVAVLAAAWLARRRIGGGVFFALAYFVAILLPVLGFMQMFFHRFTFVSDHLQYLALPATLALAAALAARTAASKPRLRRPLILAGALIAAALAVGTSHQSLAYRNKEAMWRDVMAKSPSCALAYYNVGIAYADRRERLESLLMNLKALELDPNYSEAYNNSGQYFGFLGEHATALRLCLQALRAYPSNGSALQNVVTAASCLPAEQAQPALDEAMTLVWDRPNLLNNLAVLLVEGPPEVYNPPRALHVAKRMVERDKKPNPQHLDTLAGTYAHNGQLDLAIRIDQQSLKLTKGDPDIEKTIRRNLSRYRAAVAAQATKPALDPRAPQGLFQPR